MPKHKTRKSAAKRFKRTAGGKLKYDRAGAGHLMTAKNRKRKRRLRKTGVLSSVETRRIDILLAR
jgi:large subunit ribosomal protein L35